MYSMEYLRKSFDIKIEAGDKTVFLTTLLACVIAYSYIAFHPVWVPDDIGWQVGLSDIRGLHSHGRWALWMWGELTEWQPLSMFSWIIAILCYSATGVLVGKLWGVHDRNFAIILAVLFATYPGFIQEGKWDVIVAPFGIAHLLATLAIYISYRSIRMAALSGMLLTVSIAIYQSLVSYALVLVLLTAAISIARENVRWDLAYFKNLFLNPLVTGVVGVSLYILSLVLYKLTGRSLGRGIEEVDHSLNIPDRVVDGFAHVFEHVSYGLDDLYGRNLLLLLIVVSIVIWLKAAITKKQYNSGLLIGVFTIMGIAAIYLHQYVSPKIQHGGWEIRAATGISLLAPFMIAICYLNKQKGVQLLVLLLGSLLSINWIVYAESYAHRLHAKSREITLEANRILTRVESHTGYTDNKPIIFPYGYNLGWYKYSAYRTSNEFLQFFSGKRMVATKPQIVQAQVLAGDMAFWPAQNSIKVTEEMIIITMDTPLARAIMENENTQAGTISTLDALERDRKLKNR